MRNGKEWGKITSEEAYRLSMAEFKGATMHALQDLKEMHSSNSEQIKTVDGKVEKISDKVGNLKLISGTIGAVGGIITAILAIFFSSLRN